MSEPGLDYKVRLEVFEGPLDLLLYLIRKEEVEVWDVPISRITEQYLQYLDLMRELNLDVAGEFILMAATLAHIKSRELLPKDPTKAGEEEEDEGDPRAELIRRLLEYQKYRAVAEDLSARPLLGRDTFERGEANVPNRKELAEEAKAGEGPLEVSLFALLDAFRRVMERIPAKTFHEVEGETVSVAEKATMLAARLRTSPVLRFTELFDGERRKVDVVATFLALLEMVRMKLLAIVQAETHGEIEIRSTIPEGTDVAAVLQGTDIERAFAYGVGKSAAANDGPAAVAAPAEAVPSDDVPGEPVNPEDTREPAEPAKTKDR